MNSLHNWMPYNGAQQSSHEMLEVAEILSRLGSATVIGCLIGLNRDLHGKPTGVRTLGLVGLGSALVVLGMTEFSTPGDPNAVSRVVQGILTGIGFLGAGVIFHNVGTQRIFGVTTAACVWLTACIGMMCGIGEWRLLIVAVSLLFLLLVIGGPIEEALHRRWGDALDKSEKR